MTLDRRRRTDTNPDPRAAGNERRSAPDWSASPAGYPVLPERLPREDLLEGRYRVTFARNLEQLDEVLRLRYEVFNLEMGEGLEHSHETGRDQDAFDEACHHLMVVQRDLGRVVGTYRLQTLAQAERHRGFYSAGEFDLAGVPRDILDASVEVGRACVARTSRMSQVLFLLWKGLIRYLESNQKRYFFGCCSLPTQDSAVAFRIMERLVREGHLHPAVEVSPLPECACRAADAPVAGDEEITLPPLFGMYLRWGGKICGPPAIDREFRTIDFFMLFDVEAMEPAAHRSLFGW